MTLNNQFQPDPARIALGIQQPWAELILRGIKTLEIRSCETQVRGTIYLYTSKRLSEADFAITAAAKQHIDLATLPRGLLVGTVEILGARPATPADAKRACVPAKRLAECFAWELANPQRLAEPQPVRFLPYGVWFYPFRRKSQSPR